jgi:Tfp pilus assembly protein PilX
MNNLKKTLKSEEGSVLFFTLLILVMMAVAGFTMIANSVLESNIVRNASSHTINFYAAESAAMEAAQKLDDEIDVVKLTTNNEDWLNPNGPSDPKLSVLTTPWDYDGSAPDTAEPGSTPSTAFTTVRVGVAKSASLGMENPDLLYEYTVLGRYYDSGNNPMAMIEAGFLKRY